MGVQIGAGGTRGRRQSAHSEINALGKVLSGPERWPLRAGRCLARTSNLKAGLPDWAASELRASIEAATEAGKTSVFSKEGLCTLDPEASRRFAEIVKKHDIHF